MPQPVHIYRTNYVIQAIFTTFMATYFTLFLLFTTSLDKVTIAGILTLIQLPLIARPILGWWVDRHKHYIATIATGVFFFAISMGIMALFYPQVETTPKTLLFALMYLGFALFDVGCDAIMVTREKSRSGSAIININTAQTFRGVFVNIIFMVAVGASLTGTGWHLLLGIIAVSPIPLLIIALKTDIPPLEANTPAITPEKLPPQAKKVMGLIFIFVIFMNTFKMAEYPLEPYLVDRFGASAFTTYLGYLSVAMFLGLFIFIPIIKFQTHFLKYRIRYLIASGLFAIGFWLCLGFGPFGLILLLTLISGAISHILSFCYLTLFVECTPRGKESLTYQSYSTTYLVSSILFGSLGLVLDAIIGAQWVFVLVAVLLLLNVLVVPFIKLENFIAKVE
jgi:MFS family permease